ncbi:MAG: hypothetical protein LBQ12_02410 [Deltaproteobacteria bacterium]|jgi:predicted Mrr-cat superfamily restriction endonuclease|nr:hypothetical protein [Deltaproteobacteria bacterium]
MTRKLWAIRPAPNFTNRLDEFLSNGMVAVGWPGVGDLGAGLTRQDIKERLRSTYEHYKKDASSELGTAVGILDRFANVLSEGDFILVPDGEDVYVCEVKGGYSYRPELDQDTPDKGYPHWREVKFLKDGEPVCKAGELPLAVRRAIDCRLALFAVTGGAAAMWKFLGLEPDEAALKD